MKQDKGKASRHYYNNHLGELPTISISKRKVSIDVETAHTEITIKGFTLQECYEALEKVKALLKIAEV